MSAASKILKGLDQAVAHARGDSTVVEHRLKIPESIDVRKLRSTLNLSQAEFSMMFGFKLDTVRNWEQEKRVPNAQARALLKIIEHDPDGAIQALMA